MVRRFVIVAGVLAGLAVPATASAAVYCVNTPSNAGCDFPTYPANQLQQALNDAQATNMVNDTVKIGPGTYQGPFSYSGTGGSSEVLIQGAGRSQTFINIADTAGSDRRSRSMTPSRSTRRSRA